MYAAIPPIACAPAPVTRPHQQLGISAHERDGHRDPRSVGQDEPGMAPELLDHAEDVVPAPGVEAGRVLAQLVQDLVHLERCQDRLDQDRRADRATREPEPVLRPDEDVVPQTGLEMALELREIEVGTGAALELLPRVVDEREPEVEQAPRDRRARRRAGDVRAGASRVAERAASPGRPESRYSRPSGPVSSIVRRIASARFTWPPTMFDHVGAFASSRSAMKHRAPLLSALITILRSVGPVISTRRSRRSGGAGATFHSDSRTERVDSRNSGRSPSSSRTWRSARASSSSARRPPNSRCRPATNASASSVRISSNRGSAGPRTSTPSGMRHARPLLAPEAARRA